MTYLDYLNDFNQWLETNALPVSSQLMYFRLLNIFNRAGWPEYVGVDNLRFQMMLDGAAKTTVIRARDKLIEAGFITYQKGRRGAPNRYALTGERSNIATENATENATLSATENATLNATHIKTKTKTKTKNTPPVAPPPENHGFGEELSAAFSDWLAYKKERREPYKPMGLKSLVTEVRNNAAIYGEAEVARLIRSCMAAGWKGIIFDRLKKQGQTNGGTSGGGNVFLEIAREEGIL